MISKLSQWCRPVYKRTVARLGQAKLLTGRTPLQGQILLVTHTVQSGVNKPWTLALSDLQILAWRPSWVITNSNPSNATAIHGCKSREQNWLSSLNGLCCLSPAAARGKQGYLWAYVRGWIELSSKCVTLPCDVARAAAWKGVACECCLLVRQTKRAFVEVSKYVRQQLSDFPLIPQTWHTPWSTPGYPNPLCCSVPLPQLNAL